MVLVLGIVSAAAPSLAQPTPASLKAEPAALQLFERDWVLMQWAKKSFDMNRDMLLQPDEASAAAEKFRSLADTDRDGRVTTQEYRTARETILLGG